VQAKANAPLLLPGQRT